MVAMMLMGFRRTALLLHTIICASFGFFVTYAIADQPNFGAVGYGVSAVIAFSVPTLCALLLTELSIGRLTSYRE